jgi:restriction endonuclease Mrr
MASKKNKQLVNAMINLKHLFHDGSLERYLWDKLIYYYDQDLEDAVIYERELINEEEWVAKFKKKKVHKNPLDSVNHSLRVIKRKIAVFYSRDPKGKKENKIIYFIDKFHLALKERRNVQRGEKYSELRFESILDKEPLNLAAGYPKVSELFKMHKSFTNLVQRSVLGDLSSLSPDLFNFLAKKILSLYGLKNLKITLSTDSRLCGNARYDSVFDSVKIYFECKRSDRAFISDKEVEEFRSRINGNMIGFFLTTARLTSKAKRDHYEDGLVPIVLADGASIAELVIDRHSLQRHIFQLYLYTAIVTKALHLLKRKPNNSYLY